MKNSKKWCKHIKYETTTYGWKQYFFVDADGASDTDGWVACPICLKPRPGLKAEMVRLSDILKQDIEDK